MIFLFCLCYFLTFLFSFFFLTVSIFMNLSFLVSFLFAFLLSYCISWPLFKSVHNYIFVITYPVLNTYTPSFLRTGSPRLSGIFKKQKTKQNFLIYFVIDSWRVETNDCRPLYVKGSHWVRLRLHWIGELIDYMYYYDFISPPHTLKTWFSQWILSFYHSRYFRLTYQTAAACGSMDQSFYELITSPGWAGNTCCCSGHAQSPLPLWRKNRRVAVSSKRCRISGWLLPASVLQAPNPVSDSVLWLGTNVPVHIWDPTYYSTVIDVIVKIKTLSASLTTRSGHSSPGTLILPVCLIGVWCKWELRFQVAVHAVMPDQRQCRQQSPGID